MYLKYLIVFLAWFLTLIYLSWFLLSQSVVTLVYLLRLLFFLKCFWTTFQTRRLLWNLQHHQHIESSGISLCKDNLPIPWQTLFHKITYFLNVFSHCYVFHFPQKFFFCKSSHLLVILLSSPDSLKVNP